MSDSDSENKAPAEPTMEEILASIRRIISEEEAAAQNTGPQEAGQNPPLVDFTEILELTNALPPELLAAAAAPAPASTPAPAASAPQPAASADMGLEALVRSILAPHLKTWLDAHLPEIVEKMVAAEIARIAQNRNTPSN